MFLYHNVKNLSICLLKQKSKGLREYSQLDVHWWHVSRRAAVGLWRHYTTAVTQSQAGHNRRGTLYLVTHKHTDIQSITQLLQSVIFRGNRKKKGVKMDCMKS